MPIARNRPSIELKPRKYDTAGLPTRYFGPGELEALLHLYELVAPKVIIEFGVNTGRNAAAALRNIAGLERYVGVDVPPGYQTHMPVQRNEVPDQPGQLAAHDPRFELVIRERGTFDLLPADLPQADAVFIDADHSRLGVEHDYLLACQITRQGGIVIFHDDNGLPVVEVTQTLNDICASGARIKHVQGTWLSYQFVGADGP
jgi:predicted O-methyltransferase YrrM